MSVNIRKRGIKGICGLEHHRNPSGFHNKVLYLISECKYSMSALHLLKKQMVMSDSWDRAFWVAKMIICKKFERIKIAHPEHWYWVKEFVNKEREWRKHL